MRGLSIDYERLVRGLDKPLIATGVGEALFDALAVYYRRAHSDCSLVAFVRSGATFLFDLASAVAAPQVDRTVAAWTMTPITVDKRDTAYQRGFPLPPGPDSTLVDRGHLIPHLSSGEFGPNIFRQHRALNRGWSTQGKRFRALEREAATPGTFYFGHLLYEDNTAYPTEIETGLIRGDELHVERFRNRFPPHGQRTNLSTEGDRRQPTGAAMPHLPTVPGREARSTAGVVLICRRPGAGPPAAHVPMSRMCGGRLDVSVDAFRSRGREGGADRRRPLCTRPTSSGRGTSVIRVTVPP